MPTAISPLGRSVPAVTDRNRGLELEAAIVGRRIDRHQRTGWLDTLLGQIGVHGLEHVDDGLKHQIPVPGTLEVDDVLRLEGDLLAEQVHQLVGWARSRYGLAEGRHRSRRQSDRDGGGEGQNGHARTKHRGLPVGDAKSSNPLHQYPPTEGASHGAGCDSCIGCHAICAGQPPAGAVLRCSHERPCQLPLPQDERSRQRDCRGRHAPSPIRRLRTTTDARMAAAAVHFDQMMVLYPARAPETDAFVRIYNNDGSEAEACGNGMRCVADVLFAETGEPVLTFGDQSRARELLARGTSAGFNRRHGRTQVCLARNPARGRYRRPRDRAADGPLDEPVLQSHRRSTWATRTPCSGSRMWPPMTSPALGPTLNPSDVSGARQHFARGGDLGVGT